MWRNFLCVLFCLLYSIPSFAKSVRTIEADPTTIIPINTAIGYSTIVEFSSKPISAVLGDQDAFKLEYVGNSITLKPLVPHAQSNLFVFTEYDRFNCTVRTVQPPEVDYIVRVNSGGRGSSSRSEYAKPSSIPIKAKGRSKGILFSIKSRSTTLARGGTKQATVFEFEISSDLVSYLFSGNSLGVMQGKRNIPIETIYLDSVILRPGKPISGRILLLYDDFVVTRPVLFTFSTPGGLIKVEVPTSLRSKARKE